MEYSAYFCLLMSAFTAAFSLPVGRSFAALSLVFAVWARVRSRRAPVFSPVSWLALAFTAVAVFATLVSPYREIGQSKLIKLVWLFVIPLAATLVTSRKRLIELVGAYAFGTAVLAAWLCITHPLIAWANWSEGLEDSYYWAVVNIGSMTDGQRLMVGLILSLGFLLARLRQGKTAWFWCGALVLQAVAFVLMFKRGSWICATAFIGVFLLLRAGWRYFAGLAALVLVVVLLPPVQSRLGELRDEIRNGGRMVMWTKVAPPLVQANPMGVGWRCLTSDMMKKVAPDVEPDRTHLHSNPVEVLVETGWLGLAVFVVWMIWALVDAIRGAYAARSGPVQTGMILTAILLSLGALMANGLVEYNFGDAEIVLVYSMLMGAVAAMSAKKETNQ